MCEAEKQPDVSMLRNQYPPTSNLLSFHTYQVMLLAEGRLVYIGPPSASGPAFVEMGQPCPGTTSMADHMVVVVGEPSSLSKIMDRCGTRECECMIFESTAAPFEYRLSLSEPGALL